MQFVIDFLLGTFTLYLAFTNSLADVVATVLPSGDSVIISNDSIFEESPLTQVPSRYEEINSIPDILIKNTAYQGASAVSAITRTTNPSDPIDAIVNIYCTYKTATSIRTTTGTGFFIQEDGIILTNAHVAQFLLLASVLGDSECIIRTGNPAAPTYTADLLYISPAWVREYASIINEEKPKGTGERDYALLYVNGGIGNKPMPSKFPALKFNSELLKTSIQDTIVTAAGYPAQALIDKGADVQLIPKEATTTITELMTFGSNYADLFTISGSVIGEQGSSGGPVVNAEGAVIGVIVTRGDDTQFGNGSLRALTLSYINRTIEEETGFPLWRNLTGNLPYRAQLYKETMIPFLETYLRWEL